MTPSGEPEPGADRGEPEQELIDVPYEGEIVEARRVSTRAWVGRFAGPVLAVLVYLVMPVGEDGVSEAARGVASVGTLMAVWWVSEALPLPATSLLPIALFPLLGVHEVGEATAPYASDIIFLFMGGFLLALAMQRWGLHRRIALLTVMAVGTRPVRVVGGFMLATALLSMWVSNTATTVMMLPIGLSVLHLTFEREEDGGGDHGEPGHGTGDHGRGEQGQQEQGAGQADRVSTSELTGEQAPAFATCLMLAIAYAASIGSLATLIGTPPNLFMAGFLEQTYDVEIGFGQWMLLGLPLAAVLLALAYVVLTRWVYPPQIEEIPGGRELFAEELRQLGRVGRGERIVLTVFVCTALAWVLRGPLTDAERLVAALPGLAGLSDAGIAITAAIVLFLVPVDWRRGVFTLDWTTARKLPWGVLLLFGGGLSLASGVSSSGLDAWIGQQVGALGGLPVVLLIVVVAAAVIFLTELTSNTATAATFLPILGGVALGLDLDPVGLIVPAALAATCAFMMPVATPPNAIVFGSGHITIPQMVRAGWWLNLAAIALITAATYFLATLVLGFALG